MLVRAPAAFNGWRVEAWMLMPRTPWASRMQIVIPPTTGCRNGAPRLDRDAGSWDQDLEFECQDRGRGKTMNEPTDCSFPSLVPAVAP